ncbi:MAG: class I adenylate-forming enzyme family protein [Alphaproteobacteria bacterium]
MAFGQPSLHLIEALRLNARRMPRRPAMVFKGRVRTYAEMYERATRFANALRARGYGKDDKISILSWNHDDFFMALFAITGIGAVPALINYRITDDDIRYCIETSDSRALLLGGTFADKMGLFAPATEEVIFMDADAEGQAPDGALSLEALIAAASDEEVPRELWGSQIMLHTSGTTGRPKGALRTRIGFEERTIEQGFRMDDRKLCIAPACLGTGTYYGLLPMYLGGTSYLMENFDPEEAIDIMERERITAALLLPTMLRDIVDSPRWKTADLGALHLIQSGAGEVDRSLKEAVIEKCGPILGIWAASSETGPYANIKGPAVLEKADGNCVGQVFFGTEMKLLDDDGNEVPQGEIGEICVKCDSQFDGYYKDPELTETTRRGEFITVGDLGYLDADGYLFFTGRKRDVIKSGGINIYAPEIEEKLREHAAIADAACVGVPDPKWIEMVCAVIVREKGAELSAAEVDAFCQETLARYKRPRRILFLESLPRNLTGRVLKAELREIAARTVAETEVS